MNRFSACCPGCDVPLRERVNLPKDWKKGDPLPKGLTIHREPGRSEFAFRGEDILQDRVNL